MKIEVFITFIILITLGKAQDEKNQSTTLTEKNIKTLEIVFLHHANHSKFMSAVDQIMEQLQNETVAINYHKISYDKSKFAVSNHREICKLGSNGISLFIDATFNGLNFTVRDYLKRNNVPYFRFDFSIQSFVKIMQNFLVARGALDAVFIFQDSETAEQALYSLLSVTSIKIIVLDQHQPNVISRLKTLRPTPSYYAIIGDTVNVSRIFQAAFDFGLVSQLPDRWNLMFTDYDDEKFTFSGYPEMSRLLLDKTVCCNPKCICSSQNTINFMAFKSFLHQILLVLEGHDYPIQRFECNKESDKSVRAEKLLEDLSMTIRKNNLIYFDDDSKIFVNLKYNVKTNVDNSSVVATTAIVNQNGVTSIGNNRIKVSKRFMRIGVTESAPYTFIKRDSKTKKILRDGNNHKIYEGFCIDFIEMLSKKMNFTYELVEPTSGKFGKKLADGNFDGLIGDLERGETDFIIAALKMTAEREERIDFVAPYFDQTGIRIVMKKPIPDTSLFKFMTVLRLEVWLSILGALSVTAFVIWILEVFSPYSGRNWSYGEESRKFTLRESFWFTLTSFTPQGGGEAPKALSSRVIVAAYWLFVVLMLATFTANLAAFLTVERMQSPVQSLDQLARQSRIKYTVVKDSDTHKYFQNMKYAEDTLYELWKNMTLSSRNDEARFRVWDYPIKEQYASILMAIEGTKPLPNASEGFRIVNERVLSDFAFIHDANEIKYEISRSCAFAAVGDIFSEQPYAVAVQQGSHLRDEISRFILELQKDRFFEDLTAKYWNSSNKGSCLTSDDYDSEGITLESLGGIFIATLIGLVIAMLVLVGEVYYYKRKSGKVKEMNMTKPVIFTTKIDPLHDINISVDRKIMKNSVLLGHGEFVPVEKRKSRLSFSPRIHHD
ncbi:CLUMA_CG021272, isoform A [Clunio marinus]|uniref:CLUMA_CG021272, isoform A n=1 Tax=Clunio marinus TaxID=568069 RepID=A0A1J1J9E7_9DIPT|nr:CLUMA_CG021272, isoform A [Clunio marinus]